MATTTITGVQDKMTEMQGDCPDFAQDIEQFIWALFLIDSVVETSLASAGYTEFSVQDEPGVFWGMRRYHHYRICARDCFVSFRWKKNKIDNLAVRC